MKQLKALPVILAALLSFGAKAQKASVTVSKSATTSATTAATTGMSQYTTYDFNWKYTANLPACTTSDVACWDGYILTNVTTNTVVATQANIGTSLLSYSYSPSAGIPYGTTNFTLAAHGYDENGAPISSTATPVSVVVTAPTPTVSIAANPTTVNLGSSSTLTVTATNGSAVTVKGSDGSSYTLAATGGTQVVTPSATTTYTATVTGQDGTTTKTAQVTVTVHIASLNAPTNVTGTLQ